jgi:hypothetical protein
MVLRRSPSKTGRGALGLFRVEGSPQVPSAPATVRVFRVRTTRIAERRNGNRHHGGPPLGNRHQQAPRAQPRGCIAEGRLARGSRSPGALQQGAQVGAGRITSMNRGRRTQGVEPLDPGGASRRQLREHPVSCWLTPDEGAVICRDVVNPKEARCDGRRDLRAQIHRGRAVG